MINRAQKAQNVTVVGFIANFILSSAKLVAGIIGNSAAMVADGVHSISDFITDIIVIGFVRVADKPCDNDHKFGHGKYETFATLLISGALFIVGAGLCYNGIKNIINAINGTLIEQPSIIALVAAIVSIIVKEILYRYTLKVGKNINSQAIIANAWHHRSDAFSSIGTTLGISGAIFLGQNWRVLDPIAGVIVSFFIINVAIKLSLPSIKELLEAALPEHIENEILDIVNHTRGVKNSHQLKTRKIGNIYAITIHVELDGQLTLTQSHKITTIIEKKLYKQYGPRTMINIHAEPYNYKNM